MFIGKMFKKMKGGVKAIFVTGTDTNAGKTIVTGLLSRYISEKGYSVVTQKWIEAGSKNRHSRDLKKHLKIMKRNKSSIEKYLFAVTPYIFKTACSPHLASRIENKKISINKIKKSFKLLSGKFDFVVVEGTGGLLVPLNEKDLIVDIVKDLKLKVLVVAKNKLGAINHTLLTIEALKRRKINILGVLFNNSPDSQEMIIKDNPQIIKKFTNTETFGILPWSNNAGKLYKSFSAIGNKIWEKITR